MTPVKLYQSLEAMDSVLADPPEELRRAMGARGSLSGVQSALAGIGGKGSSGGVTAAQVVLFR